ncbi:MAG: hypothetical protein A2092_14440 [Rhodobacteraceae bacterium GWE1_64_9]|nr:MAG: hypothetical protein A2092_14440 [Rhodobacteraceae bacterium GWE1_64_9]
MRNKALAAAALVAAGLAVAATGSRLQPDAAAAPPAPIPVIAGLQPQDRGLSARLLAADDLPADLHPSPLQAEGRLVWMQPGQSLRHHWPGLVIHGRFDGTLAYLVFDDAVNRFRLTVDGARETALILTRPGRAVIELAGLAPGPHDITLEKLNESAAPAGFGGIWAKAAAPAAPADRRPLIEFIGDSETVGYGNTAPGRDCTAEAVFLATDSTAAFPARVAAGLGGQARGIAQSGIGIVRNHEGLSPGITMTDLYPLDEPKAAALPALPEPPAQLVVLALGSNDFSTPLDKGESWDGTPDLEADAAAGLAELARAALQRNPGAELLLLAFAEHGDSLMEAHRQAMAHIKPEAPQVRLVTLPALDRTACQAHPSVGDHARIAEILLATIAELPPQWRQ